ncbi:MAG: transcriptional regulator, AraC family [Ferruginibacter sp.]|nr:transcriptional regulator, AraC family [Ferruginibacter sp.]
MNNTYDYSVSRPGYFKQLAVKELLFLHYLCPQIDPYLYHYQTHFNQVCFTLDVGTIFQPGSDTWHKSENNSIFACKAAWKRAPDSGTMEILSFYFPDNFLQQFYKEHRRHFPVMHLPGPPGNRVIEININEITLGFFYSIMPYFSPQALPLSNLLELKFRELLFIILSNPANIGLLAYVNSMDDQHKPPLQDIMDAHFNFNLSLADFARIAQRSLATFKRDFTEMYHTTPGKWLAQKRLEYAKLLLNSSKKNVHEVAYDSGFENATHFSRVFKEKFGLAPLQFRKQNTAMNA